MITYVLINYSIAPPRILAGTEHDKPHDPTPERYYDWMLLKMRQERKKEEQENYEIGPDKLQEIATMKE